MEKVGRTACVLRLLRRQPYGNRPGTVTHFTYPTKYRAHTRTSCLGKSARQSVSRFVSRTPQRKNVPLIQVALAGIGLGLLNVANFHEDVRQVPLTEN